ncbi:MAG TPA: pyridoxamine 5'-phosphate oxidase family protein [Dermatophilaceae bacterium]|nr:pyridoxamine 5'-phosphate oxidase family protein [Dermatophilaceae bacterium]
MSTEQDDRSRPDPARGPDHDVPAFERLVEGQRTCMFTTIDTDGGLHARPMTVQALEGPTVWFMAYSDSPKLDQLAGNPQVNLAFVDGDSWVSARGTGALVDDVAKKEQLWNRFAEAWFQCEASDPRVALIRVDLTGGEYWDAPSRPAQLIGLAKVLVAGERPDDGDNAKLDLA